MQVKLCNELEQLKRKDQEKYNQVIRILKFMYKTVGEGFFDAKINSSKLSEEIYRAAHIGGSSVCRNEIAYYTEFKNDLFKRYIESNGGIIDTLFEMIQEPSFFSYFFEKIDVAMTTFECGITHNTDSYTYIYNLYAMLKIYQNKKENYDEFKLAIDDIAYLFTDVSQKTDFRKTDKKVLIDKISANEFFPQSDLLRGLMVRTITEARKENDEKEKKRLDSMFMYLSELLRDKKIYLRLGYVGHTIKPEIFDTIAGDITLLVHPDLLPGCEPFYDPILLFKNRYKSLKEGIKSVGVNHREEVYSYFINLHIGLFEEINQNQEVDSFDECVKNIFDSDTYYELYRKLEALTNASDAYQKQDKNKAFALIKSLKTDQYKEALLGCVLEYPKDKINKIDKPTSISERTKYLYLKHDLIPESFNWEILNSKEYSLKTLKEKMDAEAFEYYEKKKQPQQQDIKPIEEPKQKKKSRFNIFG